MVDLGEPIFPPFSSQSTCFEAFSLLWSFSLLCLVVMIYRRIDTAIKSKGVELLQSHWRPDAVVFKSYCHRFIIYRWEQRLQMFEAFNSSGRLKIDAPRRIITAAKNALLEYQRRHFYAFLNELALYFKKKWEIHVHKFIVSRLFKRKQITHKKKELMRSRSQLLRIEWQAKMQNVTAEQLIFCDEFIFKVQSIWRCMNYEFIDETTRWSENMRRDVTYNILSTYIVDNYLCTDIKQGFYNIEEFLK